MGRGETRAQKLKRKKDKHAGAAGSADRPTKTLKISCLAQESPTLPTETEPIDTTKPTAIFKPTAGRSWTVSVALPGSIIANAQTHESRTALAGTIARALSVFCVDEVVVFSDGTTPSPPDASIGADSYTATQCPDHFLAHLLAYLETPPHLRRLLCPLHPNLRTAGTLPSLDLPHHLRATDWLPYREGASLPSPSSVSTPKTTFVETGLRIPVTVPGKIPPHQRVTVSLPAPAQTAHLNTSAPTISGEAVDPSAPRTDSGFYWGYNVRRAESLSAVFEECPWDGGYDVSIGTSERGIDVAQLRHTTQTTGGTDVDGVDAVTVPRFNHLVLVFGGVSGLEVAAANDSRLAGLGVHEARDVVDYWVNVCPGQGSRTIRTEEAIWIGCAALRGVVGANYRA